MADLNIRLSPADQVFINAIAFLASQGIKDADHIKMALDVLRETLSGITRGHVFLEPLAEAADQMVLAWTLKDRTEQRAAYSIGLRQAGSKLPAFFLWRLGLAQAALTSATQPAKAKQ